MPQLEDPNELLDVEYQSGKDRCDRPPDRFLWRLTGFRLWLDSAGQPR